MAKQKKVIKAVVQQMPKKAPAGKAWGSSEWLVVLALIIITLIVFSPSLKNAAFLDYDDDHYVSGNPMMQSATISSFNQPVQSTYLPLTMISFWLNYNLIGPGAQSFHIINVLLHVCNSVLVFLLFLRLAPGTQQSRLWMAGIVAFLFALHPMHVESVAWISERKDVLYAFFYFAALLAYTYYAESTFTQKKYAWLLGSMFLFLLSLLSKGQAVTLPLVLLVIDYLKNRKWLSWDALKEKIPFFALALIFGVIAVFSQGVALKNDYPFGDRFLFAFYAFTFYLYKIVLPIDLSLIYAYPARVAGSYPVAVYLSPVIIIVLAALIYKFRSKKNLVAGVLFFTACIIPLIVLPVGGILYADRYSYVSYAGLFFIAAAGFNSLAERYHKQRPFIAAGVVIYLLVFAQQSYVQNQVFTDEKLLWGNVVEKQPCSIAFDKLATYYSSKGNFDTAFALINQSILYDSTFTEARLNRAYIYGTRGQLDLALSDCNSAAKSAPEDARVYQTRGTTYAIMGKPDMALSDLRNAIKYKAPVDEVELSSVYNMMGQIYKNKGLNDSAALMQNLAERYKH